MSDEHVLLAYGFDGKGGARPLKGKAISQTLKADTLGWAHLDGGHPDTKPWIEQALSYLDPFITEALLAVETRPRMTQIGEGVLLILRGVNLNKNADPEDMVSIRLWIDPHRIVSVRHRRLKAVQDIDEKIQAGNGPKDAGDFLCMLVSRLWARMEPVLTKLNEEIDDIEEAILEDSSPKMREDIIRIRRQAIMFRRYMLPQRDAIGQLHMSDLSWLSKQQRRHLQESYNNVTRYVEDLDAVRERAQIVKDELANILSDRLNKNMYFISVIAAIFLPLGFLTGLLGINVAGIPGANDAHAFYEFCGILAVIVVLQVLLFKKFKWF